MNNAAIPYSPAPHALRAVIFVICITIFLGGCSRPTDISPNPTGPTTSDTTIFQESTESETNAETSDTADADTTGSTATDAADTAAPIDGTAATTASTAAGNPTTNTTPTTTPAPNISKDEMRGVWVSFIELDSMLKQKTVDGAKAVLDKVMDDAVSAGLNTVIFHVRSHSNAYYRSNIFKAAATAAPLLDAGLDPLAYALESAHARGLSFHAWINPYRIGVDTTYSKLSGNNIFSLPDTGNRTMYYYVPSSVEAQKLIIDGVTEVVSNYNVDGVQFDDYFYPETKDQNKIPYISPNSPTGFESADYERYLSEGGKMSIGDWRRSNVNALISSVYRQIKNYAKNRSAVFGISPSYNVNLNYNSKYADVTLWMSVSGYLDYIAPQVYFGFEHPSAPFIPKTEEWARFDRHSSVKLYVGLAMYKSKAVDAGSNEWINSNNIIRRQVECLRGAAGIDGFMVYTYSSFANFPEEANNLKTLLKADT